MKRCTFRKQPSHGGGSPSRTPTSSTSLQEMAFNFPAEKGPEGGGPMPRRGRRASMQDALDLSKFNASLYEQAELCKQESIESIPEENLGSINFSLFYNREQSLLTLRLIQARELVPKEEGGSADPYCRVSLTPHRKQEVQSKVHKKTLCPEFEEEFIFEVPSAELDRLSLKMLVYNYDHFSCDECMGQMILRLEQVDFQDDRIILWKPITKYERDKEESSLGDLMFSLSYLPSAERLTVQVLKGRNIRLPPNLDDSKHVLNPYIKVSLISGGKRIKKKKTSCKRNNQNPTWNEALVFNLGKEYMKSLQIEFLLINDSLLTNNECLGKVCISENSTGDEKVHWEEMLSSKITALAKWHRIRPADDVKH